MISSETIYELVGAACGLGSDNRATAQAPQAFRSAGVLERLKKLGCNVVQGRDVTVPSGFTEDGGDSRLRNLPAMKAFADLIIDELRAVYRKGHFPLVLGGDHALSMASVSVAAEILRERSGAQAELGLLWVDAHGDLNTAATTPSGNLHGMPVATLLGYGEDGLCKLCGFAPKVKPENVVLVGVRDLDPGEKEFIKKLGLTVYTMKDVDNYGLGEIARRAYEQVTKKTQAFVLSFDIDVCDPLLAPAVGTPVRGGFTFREAHLMMELAAEHKKLMSVELVEFNPSLDKQGTTLEVALSLLESAVGKTIL